MTFSTGATFLGILVAVSAAGCGGGPTAPSAPPIVTVSYSPAAGATVAQGSHWEVRVDDQGGKGHYFEVLAFVRDDGVYGAPLTCGETDGGSGGGSGGTGMGGTHDPRVAPLGFAVGHRVNLVVLFGSSNLCPGGASAAPVDPSQADLGRHDEALNWLIGG